MHGRCRRGSLPRHQRCRGNADGVLGCHALRDGRQQGAARRHQRLRCRHQLISRHGLQHAREVSGLVVLNVNAEAAVRCEAGVKEDRVVANPVRVVPGGICVGVDVRVQQQRAPVPRGLSVREELILEAAVQLAQHAMEGVQRLEGHPPAVAVMQPLLQLVNHVRNVAGAKAAAAGAASLLQCDDVLLLGHDILVTGCLAAGEV
mmetsp:Transcript_30207/g.77555  ORF Transcript_30207/g.77555 Transcript_30207/m.77555 type:complete len:204 (+) Transcript_30207:1824-2435(+)